MKNKHLLLLFLLALVIGIALRQAPWRNALHPVHPLLQIDTLACTRIAVQGVGREDRVFERGDGDRWVLTEGDISVVLQPPQQALLFQTLAGLNVQQLLPTKRPDTLQLGLEQCLSVAFFNRNGPMESFRIGTERLKGGKVVTAMMLGKHEGVYWVEGALWSLFSKKIDAYRQKKTFDIVWADLDSIVVSTPDSLLMEAIKRDTVQAWMLPRTGGILPNWEVEQWLQALDGLKHCYFASYFDETRAKEQLFLEITLGNVAAPPLVLRFFRLNAPEPPDDLSLISKNEYFERPFVLQSSQNPRDFFSIGDSTIVHRLMRMPNRAQ